MVGRCASACSAPARAASRFVVGSDVLSDPPSRFTVLRCRSVGGLARGGALRSFTLAAAWSPASRRRCARRGEQPLAAGVRSDLRTRGNAAGALVAAQFPGVVCCQASLVGGRAELASIAQLRIRRPGRQAPRYRRVAQSRPRGATVDRILERVRTAPSIIGAEAISSFPARSGNRGLQDRRTRRDRLDNPLIARHPRLLCGDEDTVVRRTAFLPSDTPPGGSSQSTDARPPLRTRRRAIGLDPVRSSSEGRRVDDRPGSSATTVRRPRPSMVPVVYFRSRRIEGLQRDRPPLFQDGRQLDAAIAASIDPATHGSALERTAAGGRCSSRRS